MILKRRNLIKKVVQLQQKDIDPLRTKILKEQGGVCIICGKVPKRACLDHAHKKRLKLSGQIRGVCCSSCNVMIAKCENNSVRYAIPLKQLPSILRSIADYLEKPLYPYMHPSEAPKPKKLQKSSYAKLVKKLKEKGYIGKIPDFPKSGKLTKGLDKLYSIVNIKPSYYK